MNPADDIWAKVIELMKQQGLSPTTIKTWFDDAKAVSLTEDSFTISTPNDYTQSVIKSLYIPKIEAALKELFSMDLKVVVLTEKELENTSAAKQDILFPGTSDYTFERFVVGSSNRYAYSAARAVAEALGAESLVFLTDVGGILIDSHNSKTAVPHMDVKRAEELIDTGLIAGGMVPKVRGCVHAIRAGVGQVSILDGRVEHSLLLHMLGQRASGTTITG